MPRTDHRYLVPGGRTSKVGAALHDRDRQPPGAYHEEAPLYANAMQRAAFFHTATTFTGTTRFCHVADEPVTRTNGVHAACSWYTPSKSTEGRYML